MCSTQALLTRCLVLPLQLQRKLFVDTSEDRQLAPPSCRLAADSGKQGELSVSK